MSRERDTRFHVAFGPPWAFPPFQGVVLSQHAPILGVGPYCSLAVHDQMSSSRTSPKVVWLQTDCRSCYSPVVLTGLSVWEELLGVTRTLFLRSIRTADAVHPRAGKFQTNLATVPEYMKSSLLRMKGTLYAHRFLHPNQVMNAVVIKDANKAVNHAWPTDNSGLPLSW